MIDYQGIIDNLTEENIKNILNKLNIPFEDKGAFLVMPTYCHNHMSEEASHKLYYYKNNKVFMCFTECGGQNPFKFLQNFYEAQGIEYDWYNDVYGLLKGSDKTVSGFAVDKYKSIKDKYLQRRKNKVLETYPIGILDCFTKEYPAQWLAEGITRKSMDKFNILFSISQNKIIIPHYDINGGLVGIRGRALNEWEVEFAKYMPVQIESIIYKHPLSMNLYGLNITKENIKKHKVCYIFESEKSVLQLDGFNMDNCGVAVCGSNLNKFQLNILIRECMPSEIVICFDKEELPGEDKYFNKLLNLCRKYQNYCNFSFIYDRDKLLDLKDSPTDKGEEVFRKLLDRRVRV